LDRGAQISRPHARAWIVATLWGALFLAALCVDRPVAQWVHDHPPFDKHAHLVAVVKSPGNYFFTIGIAVVLGVFHSRGIRAAILPLIAGALGGLLYGLIKWIVGRHRPVIEIAPFKFQPFFNGFVGLFKDPGLSFPSGHTCLSFATATSLTILLPRWKYLWYPLALIVAAERVLENAHYVSDVVAGAALGTLCALVSAAVLRDGNRAS
jgi:membrane-associated phospholipid phosphatase